MTAEELIAPYSSDVALRAWAPEWVRLFGVDDLEERRPALSREERLEAVRRSIGIHAMLGDAGL